MKLALLQDWRARWESRALGIATFALVLLAAIIELYGASASRAYVAAIALGALVAVSELVARYKDAPAAALLTTPAAAYVSVNAIAAGAALFLTRTFDWDFGAEGNGKTIVQVLTAGLGSAALFRSSLFNVTAGDQVIGIGPSAVLNVILSAADRAVDRRRAVIRASGVRAALNGLSFLRSADALVEASFALMQNVPPAEKQTVDALVSLLRDESKFRGLPDALKIQIVGLKIMSVTGRRALSAAADLVNKSNQNQAALLADDLDTVLLERVKAALRDGPISLTSLRSKAGISVERAEVISELETAGVISVSGKGGEELVTLLNPQD